MSLDPLTVLLDIGGKIIDRVIPDAAARDAAKLELFKAQQAGELAAMTAQTDINKAEAASSSAFVAGWRPAIGWVCALALGYQYLLKPVLTILFGVYHIEVPVVGLDDNLWQLMFGMLGMGGLRTFEKARGVAS